MSAAIASRPRFGRKSRHTRRDHVAARIALIGAVLGILAGVAELTIGPSIREWVGDKQDTTRLGLATIVLSLVALGCATVLYRDVVRPDGRRLTIALGLLIPALICFSTVGRLWLVPGPLLIGASGLLLSAGDRAELSRAVDRRRWRNVLVALCGAYYIFLGATALGGAGLLGIVGGLVIWVSVAAAPGSRRVGATLLVIGVLPFAMATWWSAVTPLIAVVVLVIGRPVRRRD